MLRVFSGIEPGLGIRFLGRGVGFGAVVGARFLDLGAGVLRIYLLSSCFLT